MSKNLRRFQTTEQYTAYTADTANFILPNVSLVNDTNGVAYNPALSIKDAVIACDSATYNGETQVATNIVVTLSGNTLVSGTDYTVSGNEGGINAGDYTFTVNGIGKYKDSKQGTFTIGKVTPTVTTPTAKVLTYNGSAQELVNGGSTNFGTLKYSSDGTSYSISIPTATNYGSYTVYYKVEGDSNVNDVAPATVACSINEKQVTATVELSEDSYTYDGTAKEPTVTVKDGSTVIDPSEYTVTYSNNTNAGTATVTISDNVGGNYEVIGSATYTINKANPSYVAPTATSPTYNGSAQELLNGGSTSDGTIQYSTDESTWSGTIPSQTNANTYASYWRLVGDSNHNDVVSTSISTTIAKADQAAPTATGSTTIYNTAATATASGGGGQGTLSWTNGNTQTSIGSKSTKAYWEGDSNYNASPYSNEVTLTVKPGETGHEYIDLGLPSGTKWATMNVGATAEGGYGNYYQYGKGSSQYSATSGQSIYTGTENPLSFSVDTARQVWGGSWHTPTVAQFNELTANTTISSAYIGGANGKKFTAKNGSGKYIFIPYSGYYNNGTLSGRGSFFNCWSSVPDGSSAANGLRSSYTDIMTYQRNFGFSIRPVVG